MASKRKVDRRLAMEKSYLGVLPVRYLSPSAREGALLSHSLVVGSPLVTVDLKATPTTAMRRKSVPHELSLSPTTYERETVGGSMTKISS